MHERRWHFRGDCSMGLHQSLLNTGTGDPGRELQRVEGNVCCKYTLQTHASPKNKLSFKHKGARRAAVKDQWMELCPALKDRWTPGRSLSFK